jgi:hypothetical protein
MRAEIRRIDLTTEPVSFEAWPSLDWLASPSPIADEVKAPYVGPRGRGGLWEAMANAVQRAREASVSDDGEADAEVVTLSVDAPHLAYLARVASGGARGHDDARGADVIALDDVRSRDQR